MNEKQTAYAIRRELDHGADSLPAETTKRLHQARTAALAHMTDTPSEPWRAGRRAESTPFFYRFAVTAVPVVMVTVALLGVSQWNSGRQTESLAQELASLDEAVLFDELPIAAYTDKGFAVFLANNRQ